jgi:hypothetical protein
MKVKIFYGEDIAEENINKFLDSGIEVFSTHFNCTAASGCHTYLSHKHMIIFYNELTPSNSFIDILDKAEGVF